MGDGGRGGGAGGLVQQRGGSRWAGVPLRGLWALCSFISFCRQEGQGGKPECLQPLGTLGHVPATPSLRAPTPHPRSMPASREHPKRRGPCQDGSPSNQSWWQLLEVDVFNLQVGFWGSQLPAWSNRGSLWMSL